MTTIEKLEAIAKLDSDYMLTGEYIGHCNVHEVTVTVGHKCETFCCDTITEVIDKAYCALFTEAG